jgi:hypothetical protein
MDISLSGIMDSVTNSVNDLGAQASAVTENYAKLGQLANGQVSNVMDLAALDVISTTASETGKLVAQQASRDAAAKLGADPTQQGELISQLSDTIRTEYTKSQAALDTIGKKESVGFFDNPLAFIGNALTIDQDYANYDTSSAKLKLATDTYSNINALAQTEAQTQNSIATLRTQATVAGEAKKVAMIAEAKVQEISKNNIATNLQGIEAVSRINSQQLDEVFKLKGVINADTQLELSKASYELSRRNTELAIEERDQRLKDKKQTAEEEANFMTTVNDGRSAQGLPTLEGSKIKTFLSLGGDMKENIGNWYTLGAQSQSGVKLTYGYGSVESVNSFIKAKAPIPEQYKPVSNLISGAIGSVLNGPAYVNLDKKNKGLVDSTINNLVSKEADRQAAIIKPEDGTNIYQAPDLKSLGESKSVADTKLYSDVLAPAVSSGLVAIKTDPNVIVGAAMAAIEKGTLPLNTAAQDIATIFKQAALTNNQLRGYERFQVKDQRTYNASLTPLYTEGYLSSNTVVNLMDPKAVTMELTKILRSRNVQAASSAPDKRRTNLSAGVN